MAARNDIYEFLSLRGRPCTLPSKWQDLSMECPFFHMPSDSVVLLAALQQAFQLDDLLQACVVLRDVAGLVTLHPALRDSSVALLALRKAARSKPFAMLCGDQCLDPATWPLGVCLQDYRMIKQRKSQTPVTISFCPEDFQVLWTLGFPVAPTTGLANIGRHELDTFCAVLNLPRRRATQGEADQAGKPPIRLSLVGWSVARVDRAVQAGLQAVQHHLIALYNLLRLSGDVFTAWQPPAAEIERLRFCRDTGDQIDIRNAFFGSSRKHDRPLAVTPESEQVSYFDARHDWLSMVGENSDAYRRKKVWEKLQELQAKQLIEPLLTAARQTEDPLTKNLGVALADTSDLLHRQSLLLIDHCGKTMRQADPKPRIVLPSEEFNQWQTLSKQFITLIQSLRSPRQGGQPPQSSKPSRS